MMLEDLYSQEKALSGNLDQLIRLIKSQEEDFLQIDAVITKILYYRAQIENTIYIHDQIQQYKQLIEQHHLQLQHYNQRRQHLYNCHSNNATLNDKTNILLKRVAHRTLQNISITINQSSQNSGALLSKFNQLRLSCQKILSEVQQDKSLLLMRAIAQFSKQKHQILLDNLQRMANILQDGQLEELSKFKNLSFSSLNKETIVSERAINQRKYYGQSKPELSKKPIHQKIPLAKQQNKEDDQHRFYLYKKAKKVMDNLKDVLQFNRQDFIQAFIEVCTESKEKTFKHLKARNQNNQKQIASFISKNPRKRSRKMSSQPLVAEKKHQASQKIDELNQQKSEGSQSTCYTTRKSLLLKFKENEYRQKTVTTQFYRKLSRVEVYRHKAKLGTKKSTQQLKSTGKQKNNAIIKAIQKIICEKEELDIKADFISTNGAERLPPLNKRAMSVDQTYKTEEAEDNPLNVTKVVVSSVKQVQPRPKYGRWQKSQVGESKAKISQTQLRSFIQQQVNSKLINLNNLNKKLLL